MGFQASFFKQSSGGQALPVRLQLDNRGLGRGSVGQWEQFRTRWFVALEHLPARSKKIDVTSVTEAPCSRKQLGLDPYFSAWF